MHRLMLMTHQYRWFAERDMVVLYGVTRYCKACFEENRWWAERECACGAT